MNQHHQTLLNKIKHQAKEHQRGSTYMGTGKISYDIRVPQVRQIAKQFKQKHNLTQKEFEKLTISLSQGNVHQEFWLIGELLSAYPENRKELDLSLVDNILDKTEGWGEVDTVCYNTFTYNDLLNNWEQWKEFLISLHNSNNVHKRRASLVFLTAPVRYSDDQRLADLAFENIDQLKHEDHKLITKAVSWLLRSLIKHHRQNVEKYLVKNDDSLPAIAIRETRNKLETGKK